jgi:hypothetical protein
MNKHEAIVKLIKTYCINASEDAEDALGNEYLTDNSEGIFEGRYELAEDLLDQIKKWEAT